MKVTKLPDRVKADWEAELRTTPRSGELTKDIGNIATVVAHHPDWLGCLAYDCWSDRLLWLREPPGAGDLALPRKGELVTDGHLAVVQFWFRHQYRTTFGLRDLLHGLKLAAPVVHPLQAYLTELVWDGMPRLDTWLSRYTGAPQNQYTLGVGRWWMLSAVARAFQPGCKVRYMLILEGPQDTGKSMVAEILGGDWYLPHLPDLRSEDEAATTLAGRWIVEVDELDALKGAAHSRIKSFVSRNMDVYRPKYGICAVERPRGCVFFGTTNETEYFTDVTGATRFWPVSTGTIDTDGLRAVKDQLWAEAVHCRRVLLEQWWPDKAVAPILATEQALRLEQDVVADQLEAWLAEQDDFVPCFRIYEELGLTATTAKEPKMQRRVVGIMQHLHWKRGTRRFEGKSCKGWLRHGVTADEGVTAPVTAES